jgi:hypothetical protein
VAVDHSQTVMAGSEDAFCCEEVSSVTWVREVAFSVGVYGSAGGGQIKRCRVVSVCKRLALAVQAALATSSRAKGCISGMKSVEASKLCSTSCAALSWLYSEA